MTRALETPRLALEVLGPEHAPPLYRPLSDPRLYQFIAHDPPQSVADLRALFERWAARRSADGNQLWLNWAARDRDTGAYAGHFQATALADRRAFLAYIVFPDWWRRGYAREGCTAVLAHLFDDHGIERVSAEMDTENLASIRTAEALGFRRVATRPDAELIHGRRRHSHVYELTAPRRC